MKIQSIIERLHGTRVTFDDTTYHFSPDSLGRHVAKVTKSEHVQRFLAIPEGYRLLDEDAEPMQVPTNDAPSAPEIPTEPVDEQQTIAPQDQEEPQADDSQEPDVSEPVNEEVEYAELVAEFEEAYGKKPHAQMKIETLRAKLGKVAN